MNTFNTFINFVNILKNKESFFHLNDELTNHSHCRDLQTGAKILNHSGPRTENRNLRSAGLMIPAHIIKLCHLKNANLPLYEQKDEVQRYFSQKSRKFAKTNKTFTISSDKSEARSQLDLRNIKIKDASHAHAKFLWSQQIQCSDIRYLDEVTIGRG